jgi:hypothetical protein
MTILPKLFTLKIVSIAGYLKHCSPNIYCPRCGRLIGHYSELELFLDVSPKCDLITDRTDNQIFVSPRLLERFEARNITGFEHRPAKLFISDDFQLQHPNVTAVPDEIPRFHYFMVTSQSDGPWVYHSRGDPCELCHQPQVAGAPDNDLATGDVQALATRPPLRPALVFQETWHGEDVFYLTETRTLVITEAVAGILEETGNLRREKIENKERIRRLMPKYAAELEKENWEKPVCGVLGPANWVATPHSG